MPTINSALIPTKTPGTLFDSLTGGDTSLNIRWLLGTDPLFYEVLNRPIADLAVRQLIIAKSVDNLNLRLGHQALYPFVIQPTLDISTSRIEFPIGLIWDMHVSVPIKWQNLKLNNVIRISGTNGATAADYTGTVRLVFSGNTSATSADILLFYVDYDITSTLTFQMLKITAATEAAVHQTNIISPSEASTIGGYVILKTLDLTIASNQNFLDYLAPPSGELTSGDYLNPNIYNVSDFAGGGSNITDDISLSPIAFGTGQLTDSAYNVIPPLNTDINTWLNAFNYPFDADASLAGDIRDNNGNFYNIPRALFREFSIIAPSSDGPTGNSAFYPVFISKIEQQATGTNPLRFYFATRIPSVDATFTAITDFGTLDLPSSGQPGDIIPIIGIDTTDSERQIGVGFVVLSNVWDGTSTDIATFFDLFNYNPFTPRSVNYGEASTRISSYGVSRVSKYTPTKGQASALTGTSSNRSTPIAPSATNKYVTEADRGIGDRLNLEDTFGVNAAIERYGYTGSLSHRVVKLVIDSTKVPNDPTFYDNEVLPRLRVLLGGRDPEFADGWFNGTRFLWWNGDTWQG